MDADSGWTNLRKESLKLIPAAWRPLQGRRSPN